MDDPVAKLTEDHVIAMVPCQRCKARVGQRCEPTGHFQEGTQVHRGRWLKAARDLRTGRAMWPPEA